MNNEYILTTGKAAAFLGITIKTLQNWDNAGVLPARRTPGGRRYYLREELEERFMARPVSVVKKEK